jgi:hypothetical protein
MHHEIRFVFNDNNNDTTVVFDGNIVRMSNDLAIYIYNSLIDTIVEDSIKTIEKSPLTEFIHLMSGYKVVIRLNRQNGEIVEATIIFDELDESDRKLLEQGGEE